MTAFWGCVLRSISELQLILCQPPLQAGVTQAFGSDWPVVSADAITAMHTAAQMPGVDGSAEPGLRHSMAVEDAMQAHTSTAAFALGMEKHIGKLRQVLLSDEHSNYTVGHAIIVAMQAWHAGRLCANDKQSAQGAKTSRLAPACCSENIC